MLKGKKTLNNESYRPLSVIAKKAVEDSEESEDETVIGEDGSNTEEFNPSESKNEAQQLRDIEELEKIEEKGFVVDDEEDEVDEEDVDYQSEERENENEEDDEFEDEDDEFEVEDDDKELEENKPYEKEVRYKKTKKYGLVKKVTEYYPVKWS